jgi:K+-transporting ATPase ATPase C chain
MITHIRTALVLLVLFTLLTGLIYPLLITGIAQAIFPFQANGSLIQRNGNIVGSRLIGQFFTDPKYFWGRPSATAPYPYNAAASGGSNLGPTNPALVNAIQARLEALHKVDPNNTLPVPIDLVTASGSGLDPHISAAAALYQVPRIARVRGLSEAQLQDLVKEYTQDRDVGFLGEPRVNVLELNLALDELP